MSSSAFQTPRPGHTGSAHLRQTSLARYRLNAAATIDPDPDLTDLVERARARLGAEFAAVDILTTSRQLRIAGTTGVALGACGLASSLSHRAFASSPWPVPCCTPDASRDPLLAAVVESNGAADAVRFFVAAPLVGHEGVLLGALSVWSQQYRSTSAGDVRLLVGLAAKVMEVLNTRRERPDTPPGATSGGTKPLSGRGRTPAEWDIDTVIDEQAIDTLFQPIVHLDTGEIVGFEAFSRGPQGSSLESPMALLEAAAHAGRVGELDWLCRARAVQAAADSGLPASLSWFINVEPAGLAIACPDHLQPGLARARSDLRVVLEVVERDGDMHVTRLLRACDQARNDTWGVALDDVGADQVSLALLPLLQPDVVKLDVSLLRDTDEHGTARTVAAVDGYAERRGAVVLAEAIETGEQAQLARVFGARYGQGYLYGRPGPLPTTLPVPRQVIPLRQRPQPLTSISPYEILAEARPARQDTRSAVTRITSFLEDLALHARDPGVMLACVQDARYFNPTVHDRYQRLAANNAFTVVLGEQLPEESGPGFHSTPLPPDSVLNQQWVIIVLNVDDAAALAARDCGDTGAEDQRRYTYIYTHDRDLVIAAGRALLSGIDPATNPHWVEAHHKAPQCPAAATQTTPTDPLLDPRRAPRLLRPFRRGPSR